MIDSTGSVWILETSRSVETYLELREEEVGEDEADASGSTPNVSAFSGDIPSGRVQKLRCHYLISTSSFPTFTLVDTYSISLGSRKLSISPPSQYTGVKGDSP
jgi:hypothetical protein